MKRVLVVAGTRPEAIKLAPVMHALARQPGIVPRLCVTGQHRTMVDEVLALFGLTANADLDLARGGYAPGEFVARALLALAPVIARERPELILVQGDTATAFAAALAGFHARVPVAHVEAGLRTGDMASPFPEEGNRRLISQLAKLHFAPSAAASVALQREGIGKSAIHVTGNPGVDALLAVDRLMADGNRAAPPLHPRIAALTGARPIVLATVHRCENHGPRLASICNGMARIASGEDVEIVLPVHPNPAVSGVVRARLGNIANVHLVDPLGYGDFVWLLRHAALALTDSGGVQEEAPALGTPVLVMRDTTERPEGIHAGVATLVGTDPVAIAGAARAVLRDADTRAWMSRPMRLYGAGDAAPKIARIVAAELRGGVGEVDRLAA